MRPVQARPASRCCQLQLRRPAGDGRVPDPGWLRHPPGAAQRAPARVHPLVAESTMLTASAPAPGSTARWASWTGSRHQPQGARPGEANPRARCRSTPGRHRAGLPDQPRAVVDQGRIVTAGGICSGWRWAFTSCGRAGYDEGLISEVARVMEYTATPTPSTATTWRAEPGVRGARRARPGQKPMSAARSAGDVETRRAATIAVGNRSRR